MSTKDNTVIGFLHWLEAKNPNAYYDFCEPGKCAFGQWSGRSLTTKELNEFYPGLTWALVGERGRVRQLIEENKA